MGKIQTAPNQITITKQERQWLSRHAEYKDGQWYCKKTGIEILMAKATHTIWEKTPGPTAGSEMCIVFHPFCPDHQKKPKFKFGSPIPRKNLLDVQNG